MKETALRPPEDDYLIQVESFFLRKRGWGLMLSPRDWQRVKLWQSQGIPLRVALQGIDRSLRQISCTRGQVRSLAYCEREVQQGWQVYLKAKPLVETSSAAVSKDIQDKLAEWREMIIGLAEEAQEKNQLWLVAVLKELASSLDGLTDRDWPTLKAEFDHLNQWLMGQLRNNTPPSERAMLEQRVRKCLKRYASVMDTALLSQKQELLLDNLLMEKYGLSFLNSVEL